MGRYYGVYLLVKKIKHKFRAKPDNRDGIRFPSKKEAEYYDKLKRDLQEEKIIFFLMQVPFHIPGGAKYLVDFVVFDSNGTVRFIDVKGYETPQFKLKKKLVEQFYPVKIEVIK